MKRRRHFKNALQSALFERVQPNEFSDQYAHAREGLAIFTDGTCEPNPGVGGWAFVVYLHGKEIARDMGGDADTTNNKMELTSVLRALEWISGNAIGNPVAVWSDSRYAVDGATKWCHSWQRRGWTRKGDGALANLDLWKSITSELTRNPLTSIAWCKGHSGIAGNVRADELADLGRAPYAAASSTLVGNSGNALDREYAAIMGGRL